MAGFSLRCLDQDADRISVQSSHAPTWVPERRKHWFSKVRSYDVGIAPDELIVLKTRAVNTIVMTALGSDVLVRSTRRATIYLPLGKPVRLTLQADETLTIRQPNAKDPKRGHRPPTEDEIQRGFTP
jgi:hypothetical protein